MAPGMIMAVAVAVNLFTLLTLRREGSTPTRMPSLVACAALTGIAFYCYFSLPEDPDVVDFYRSVWVIPVALGTLTLGGVTVSAFHRA